jgi:hypothetical protein
MKLVPSRTRTGHFEQPQIDNLVQALKRAWVAVRNMDITGPPKEAYTLLARCIMDEARSGEENRVVLSNRAILRFRLRRARIASQKRRA